MTFNHSETPDDLEEANEGNGGKSNIGHKQEEQNQNTLNHQTPL
jgi:hypothetical protein